MMFPCQTPFRQLFQVLLISIVLMCCLVVFEDQQWFNLHELLHEKQVDSAPAPYNISEEELIDAKLCRGMEEVMGYSSIVEFGAGLGQYGRCLLRNLSEMIISDGEKNERFIETVTSKMKEADLFGTRHVIQSWEGYDGFENISYITNNWVKPINLTKKFNLGRKFDWVMSLEVGKYIPHKFENIYLDNLVRHTRLGIIISWGISDHPGHNSHTNDYVISKMEERGMQQEMESQGFLQRSVASEYFRSTLMAFIF